MSRAAAGHILGDRGLPLQPCFGFAVVSNVLVPNFKLVKARGALDKARIRNGVSQLTLVEHALCPLDARVAFTPNLQHEATYRYSDKSGRRRTATARVLCPLGLSPKDELVLWGLLGMTLATPDSGGELHATRHYCLKQLGMIDSHRKRGGRQHDDFSASIERLSTVRYQCDAFYDPLRSEHRRMAFGFFSYSIPLDDDSSRAWRFVWDPVFFEIVQATGGYLRFDLDIYGKLDSASRRLYLFFSKLFFRRTVSPRLNVQQTAEQILGISSSVSPRRQKAKILSCLEKLKSHGVIRSARVRRIASGNFQLIASRGPLFERPLQESPVESPLLEPLVELGFEIASGNRLLKRFHHQSVREWLDITLAAKERFGMQFFKSSPAAYLTDNLKEAASGRRTPPDWWHNLRKAEQLSSQERSGTGTEPVANVLETILQPFVAASQREQENP